MQCCHVAVFMYSPNDCSGYQHSLGEGSFPEIRDDSTTKQLVLDIQHTDVHCKRYFRVSVAGKFWLGL